MTIACNISCSPINVYVLYIYNISVLNLYTVYIIYNNVSARLYFFAALNSGCLWQHSTTSCVCNLSNEEELISDLQR